MRARFIRIDDKRYRLNFIIVFSVILIFGGLIAVVVPSALIASTQAQIARERAALQDRRENNAALRATFTQRYSIDEIGQAARERLFMRPPGPSQIIYIDVPKQSHVVFSVEEDHVEENEPWWRGIANFFR
jgi:hypothetical protein